MRLGEEVQEVPRGAAELSVAVAADRSEVPNGTSLRITVTVTNAGSAACTIAFATACRTDFELRDASGALVASADRMCAQMLTEATLAPGQSFAETHAWTRDGAEAGDYVLCGIVLTDGGVNSPPLRLRLV